jgi:glutaredoxin domain-containing cysteine-rich protein 1
MMKWHDNATVGAAAAKTSQLKQQARRQKQVLASPAKTPTREPEVINVLELMDDLNDKEDEDAASPDGEEERRVKSAPGPPEFDPDIITTFWKALDEVSPLLDGVGGDKGTT